MRCGVPSRMARNASLEMLFFLLIVFGGSHPSLGWQFRKLGGTDPNVNNSTHRIHDSPSPTPDPKSNSELGNSTKTDPPSPVTAPKGNPVSQNNSISRFPPPLPNTGNGKPSNNTTSATPPPVSKTDHQKIDEKGNNDGQTLSQFKTSENCDRWSAKCRDDGQIVACISERESQYVVVIVQNGGDGIVKVKLFMESNIGEIEIAEHQNKKINVSVSSSEVSKLTLKAGKGECVLHLGTPIPEEGFVFRVPSYEKVLTPVNGAYFLIVAVVIFGGTWACCKFRKKRHDGVPYQELEMAMPESGSATNEEMGEGWDQDWDDNWDEDVAVKSPGRTHAGSISANGLTARSANRDGWENDWDD